MSGYSASFHKGEIVKSESSGNNKTDDRGLWIARSHVPLRFQCLHFFCLRLFTDQFRAIERGYVMIVLLYILMESYCE